MPRMSQWYANLDRGIPAKVSKRKHIPSFMFKAAAELFSHYEEIEKAVNEIGLFHNTRQKEQALVLLGRYAPEMAQLSTQLKATDSYISQLEQQLEQEKAMVSKLQGDNDGQYRTIVRQRFEIAERKSEVQTLNRKQERLQALVDRIPPDLLAQFTKEEKRRRKNEHNHEMMR